MARRTIVLVVALVLAGVAAFSVWRFLDNIERDVLQDVELVTVYRAAEFIAEGTQGDLVRSQLGFEESEEERRFVPENAITSADQLELALSNRVAAGPISGRSILTADQWVQVTIDINPLATEIAPGMMAQTISVDDERGVNGFVEPGDRVNVILTIDVELVLGTGGSVPGLGDDFTDTTTPDQAAQDQRETKTLTRTVLQGLEVLAVGREIRPDENAAPEVNVATATAGDQAPEEVVQVGLITLEVTPEQAERLAYSFENGSVWLTLVPEDFVEVRTEGVTIDNLYEDLGILEQYFQEN
jgi:pilus assembly protein CpaB